jgi:hypothetical protein
MYRLTRTALCPVGLTVISTFPWAICSFGMAITLGRMIGDTGPCSASPRERERRTRELVRCVAVDPAAAICRSSLSTGPQRQPGSQQFSTALEIPLTICADAGIIVLLFACWNFRWLSVRRPVMECGLLEERV